MDETRRGKQRTTQSGCDVGLVDKGAPVTWRRSGERRDLTERDLQHDADTRPSPAAYTSGSLCRPLQKVSAVCCDLELLSIKLLAALITTTPIYYYYY